MKKRDGNQGHHSEDDRPESGAFPRGRADEETPLHAGTLETPGSARWGLEVSERKPARVAGTHSLNILENWLRIEGSQQLRKTG